MADPPKDDDMTPEERLEWLRERVRPRYHVAVLVTDAGFSSSSGSDAC